MSRAMEETKTKRLISDWGQVSRPLKHDHAILRTYERYRPGWGIILLGQWKLADDITA